MCSAFQNVFDTMLVAYGSQHWWPADTPFEVMVGAILTQNTAWSNVERAIANLKASDWLTAENIIHADLSQLAEAIRPSGYFNQKAARLQGFCTWYLQQGGYDALTQINTHDLRKALLSVKGIGPETADDILLYAFGRPVFVVDAYTKRIFSRLGLLKGDEGYEVVRAIFERELPADVGMFNEYHALIVQHAKQHCKKKPLCGACCLQQGCKVV